MVYLDQQKRDILARDHMQWYIKVWLVTERLIEKYFKIHFAGTLVTVVEEVAMKFTTSANRYQAISAAKEYAIYSYLNAVNSSNIEMYGIPKVYYYGRWQGYILMALTLLDSRVEVSSKSHRINVLNVLIIFREFVSTYSLAGARCLNK